MTVITTMVRTTMTTGRRLPPVRIMIRTAGLITAPGIVARITAALIIVPRLTMARAMRSLITEMMVQPANSLP